MNQNHKKLFYLLGLAVGFVFLIVILEKFIWDESEIKVISEPLKETWNYLNNLEPETPLIDNNVYNLYCPKC